MPNASELTLAFGASRLSEFAPQRLPRKAHNFLSRLSRIYICHITPKPAVLSQMQRISRSLDPSMQVTSSGVKRAFSESPLDLLDSSEWRLWLEFYDSTLNLFHGIIKKVETQEVTAVESSLITIELINKMTA
ncbi:hypothetical protein XELAEV_18005977mg [Xenopus laevis]|uniref:Uncharacterized protein n=1 Tax=Xenopus laevis TaxID=8355 RepID=A0A974DZ09_XENLA|nr:hypothetical protein XELAEV_18005977mg [Xenopus laevis]